MNEKNKDKMIWALLIVVILLVVSLIVITVIRDDDLNEERKENNPSTSLNSTTNNTNTNDSNTISSDEALQKVLDDIKLSKSDLYDLDIERDYKYDTDVYEISFKFDGYEYEYYINIKDGSIVHSFKERD